MSDEKGSFEDSEAQSFISSSESDVTAGWGNTKYQLEKSHSHTIRVYRLVLGLIVSIYIVSAAFAAWRARVMTALNAPILFQQKFIGHSKPLQLLNESILMKFSPKNYKSFPK
jgi:hypothetical protein